MTYTTFNQNTNNALLEPMFMGNSVNVSRYDIQKHAAFEKLIEKQLSFFWRPEEIDVSKDRSDWQGLSAPEKHIFISNLKYQTLLDSMAARSVNAVLLPLVSLPEIETWVETKYGQKLTLSERVSDCTPLLTSLIGKLKNSVSLPEIIKSVTETLNIKVTVNKPLLSMGV